MAIIAWTDEYLVESDKKSFTISSYADGYCISLPAKGNAEVFRALRDLHCTQYAITTFCRACGDDWKPKHNPETMPHRPPKRLIDESEHVEDLGPPVSSFDLAADELDVVAKSINNFGDGSHPWADEKSVGFFYARYAVECLTTTAETDGVMPEWRERARSALAKMSATQEARA